MTVEFIRRARPVHTLTRFCAVRARARQLTAFMLWPMRTFIAALTQRRLAAGRLRILSRCAAQSAFEYDPARDRLTVISGKPGALISTHSDGFLLGGGFRKLLPERQWAQFEEFLGGGQSEACGEFLVGNEKPLWLRLTRQRGRDGRVSGEATDVDALIRERECARTDAASDPLTGLYNRAGFECSFRAARRRQPEGGLLILADVDDFKRVNDEFGHPCGDAALKALANRLRACLRGGDIIARFGGDEFMVFLPSPKECGSALTASLARLSEKLTHIPVEGAHSPEISCSFGAVLAAGESLEQLIYRADRALYRVKRGGKGSYAIYSEELDEDAG